MPDHRLHARLHSAFQLRPEGKVVKKPLVRWGPIGTNLDQALRNEGTALEVGKWGRRLLCSLGQRYGW